MYNLTAMNEFIVKCYIRISALQRCSLIVVEMVARAVMHKST